MQYMQINTLSMFANEEGILEALWCGHSLSGVNVYYLKGSNCKPQLDTKIVW